MSDERKEMMTKRGYVFGEVSSTMQKAIRRGDCKLAGYMAIELAMSNYGAYVWRRLLTVSAEDVAGIITREIKALFDSWTLIRSSTQKFKLDPKTGRIFISKAVILLSQAYKSRDADHLTNLVYDQCKGITPEEIEKAFEDTRQDIPEYALDCHTRRGRMMGATSKTFMKDEYVALSPKIQGEFDDLLK